MRCRCCLWHIRRHCNHPFCIPPKFTQTHATTPVLALSLQPEGCYLWCSGRILRYWLFPKTSFVKAVHLIFSCKIPSLNYCNISFPFWKLKVLLAVFCFRIELEWGLTIYFPKCGDVFFLIPNMSLCFNLICFSLQNCTVVALLDSKMMGSLCCKFKKQTKISSI